MADEKQQLRKILAEARASLCATRARELSDSIQGCLVGLDCFAKAPSVVLYAAKDGEVSTEKIFSVALDRSKAIYFPRLELSLGRLTLVRATDPSELAPGAFGILEPQGAGLDDFSVLRGGVICVPGVAFAPGGVRLGRGGGHYDRLLFELKSLMTAVGLAYSFQFLNQLPESPGDQKVDLVVTELSVHGSKHAKAPHR